MKWFLIIDKLITKNTGVSSNAFALVLASIAAFISLMSFIIILFVDLFTEYKINSDMYALAAVITAIGGLFAAAFYGKTQSDKQNGANKYD